MKMFYCVVQQWDLLQSSCFNDRLVYTDGRLVAAHIDTDGEMFRMSDGVVRNGDFIQRGENGS